MCMSGHKYVHKPARLQSPIGSQNTVMPQVKWTSAFWLGAKESWYSLKKFMFTCYVCKGVSDVTKTYSTTQNSSK